jgi:FtsP/CotA-like multicopper oxidase with cupredoxin domain
MATIEFWIQLENHAWDVAPNNIDRMTGEDMQQIPGGAAPVSKTLISPVTNVTATRMMFRPLAGDALILRRYTANWAAPDDRKVNPWDLNEPDPTDTGTMGTIPGPVIECEVGDTVVVHFRNRDTRVDDMGNLLHVHQRTHSLHPHGFVFDSRYDGAYPLSPPDPTQPIAAEAPLWALLHMTANENKKGDRVPPPHPNVPTLPDGGTFTYTWNTFGWPTTSGVWHYHDHSICDMDNVQRGAIGISVIHNPADPDDVLVQDLPGGSPNGSPVVTRCFPFPFPVPTLPHDVNLFLTSGSPHGFMPAVAPMGGHTHAEATESAPEERSTATEDRDWDEEENDASTAPEPTAFRIQRGDMTLELAEDFQTIGRFCLPRYRTPPRQALYLLLFHELPGLGSIINGRKYLGNTPTVVAGLETKMRFGVVGMNMMDYHTFHLHGHRWVIPGPAGTDAATIQGSPLVQAASQFEDTKIFGPANSFSFTINQGSFMGSRFTPDPTQASGLGEWHMHCHVLMHMMDGMMGSLLVVEGGALALGLPSGEPCHMAMVMPPMNVVLVQNFAFSPNTLTVASGSQVIFDFQEPTHTVKTVSTTTANPITINNGGGDFDAVAPIPKQIAVTITGTPGGQINYECGIHGSGMAGSITIA